MKAWEVRQGDLALHNVEPEDLGEGETVVRVSFVGICGSDLPKLSTPGKFGLPEPWRPGHEIVGTDASDRAVAVDPLVPCNACPRCSDGDTHLCPGLRRIGWDLPGGFAEQVVVPMGNAHPLPRGADPLLAALADPAAVAIHGLRCTPVTPPGRLAVIGAGTVGLLTALYAHQQGWTVTVVHRDGRAPHDAVIQAVPAAFTCPSLLPTNTTFDLVVDAATGADPTPVDLALQLVTDGGTVIVQNAYHPGVGLAVPLRDLFRRSIRLIGSFSHCRRGPGDFTLAIDFLHGHDVRAAELVTEDGELFDLPAALRRQRNQRSARPVLTTSREKRTYGSSWPRYA